MLPTSSLLDCLDPALYDVVLLRDFSRRLYSRGIPGLGDDFFAMLAALRQAAGLDAYRNCVALGTSSGGLPALLAAIALGLPRGISIGGMDFARFAARLRIYGVDAAPYAALLASRPSPFPELLLVFCGAYAPEAAAARDLQPRVPSRLWAVKNCKGHNVLPDKLEQGRLPPFLANVLGQSLECDPGDAPSAAFELPPPAAIETPTGAAS